MARVRSGSPSGRDPPRTVGLMSNLARPSGPLPPQVYWFRRALVLLTLLALVYFGAKLVPGGGSSDQATATSGQSATRPVPTRTQPPTPQVAGPIPGPRPTSTGAAVLAEPRGECRGEDITATPRTSKAQAGRTIGLQIELTGISPACTFAVTPQTLAVRIVRGKDRIWSSQQCPSAIDQKKVVVRSAVPTVVTVTWNGRRSDERCSRVTAYAYPADYRIQSAVIGSATADRRLSLGAPPRPVVTRTITVAPTAKPTKVAETKPPKPTKPTAD